MPSRRLRQQAKEEVVGGIRGESSSESRIRIREREATVVKPGSLLHSLFASIHLFALQAAPRPDDATAISSGSQVILFLNMKCSQKAVSDCR